MFCSFKAKAKYLEVGKRMREYELQKYERWRVETENILPLLMKRNILAVARSAAAVGGGQAKREMVGGILPLRFHRRMSHVGFFKHDIMSSLYLLNFRILQHRSWTRT